MSDPTTTDPRIARWAEVAEAIAAGCPVPSSVYIAHDARLVRVTCLTAQHAVEWATRLGMDAPEVSTYRAGDGRAHRMTLAQRGSADAGDWLEVMHDEVIGDGIEAGVSGD